MSEIETSVGYNGKVVRNPIKKIVIGMIFCLVGAFALVVNILMYTTHGNYITTEAKVIENTKNKENQNISILAFEVDNKKYEGEGFPESTYEENSTIKIRYNPDDPNQFDIGGGAESTFLGFFLSIVFLASGTLTITNEIKRAKSVVEFGKKVKENGFDLNDFKQN